jgi:SpoVK/Ycf46/Vps4 family AAA+-type ATPase
MSNDMNHYQQFIYYLDNYQSKKDFGYYDAVYIQHAIQTHFLNNYSDYYTSIPETSYEIWQKENDVQHKIKHESIKKHIDVSIHCLKDILVILDQNPYDPFIEYNLDLNSLHKVRIELEKLNNMIGMEMLKKSIVEQMVYFIQELHINNDSSKNDYKHTILMGPPGTGKTEMAKIIGNMYAKLGVLKKNIFKKVTRTDLVAGYLGQTAIKTKKVIDECLGGVLFIDEAYAFGDDSFSRECMDILCESMSDHKDDLMVIIAGYETELNDTFLKLNSGMESRFIWRFKIDSYSPKELKLIFEKQVLDNGWEFSEEYVIQEAWFMKNKDHFLHFGRDMEILFSYIKISHALRIFGKDITLKRKITEMDVENGLKTFLQNKKTKKTEYLHAMYV